jgi:hypothetical protein
MIPTAATEETEAAMRERTAREVEERILKGRRGGAGG